MGLLVVSGCNLQCSFGAAPSGLVVAPLNKVLCSAPAANIMDNKPNVNIMPFGVCNTLSNPQVAAATSAAMGVLTPQPSIPVTTAPWTPGAPTVLIGGQPALSNSSVLMCNWGGSIQVISPVQTQTLVP